MKIIFTSCIFFLLFFTPLYGQKNIVFLVGERYNLTNQTMPALAVSLEEIFQHKTYYLNIPKNGSAENMHLIEKADLLIIYIQLRNLPDNQIKLINKHIESGKPVIAFNSTSQAFEKQPEWFAKYFGGGFRGKVNEKGTPSVTVLPENINHPIVANLNKKSFTVSTPTIIPGPLDKKAVPLLMGQTGSSHSFPVSWSFSYKNGQKIFYTSLGVADEFKNPDFLELIFNAVKWCLSEEKNSFKKVRPGNIPDPPNLQAGGKAKILFDGKNMDHWRHWDLLQTPVSLDLDETFQKFSNITNNTKPNWKIRNGALVPQPGKGDIISKESFGNYTLNLDFLIPEEPDYVSENLKGTGGIYISGRYEIRINTGSKRTHTGPISIYSLRPTDHDVNIEPGKWYNLKIQYKHVNKGPAIISAMLDGKTLHGSIKLDKPTPYGIIEPISRENPVDQSLHTVDKEFTGKKMKMDDNPFTVATRFKTTSKTGTIFSRTSQITGWERDGKAFFMGGGEIYYDIGWRAIIHTHRKVNDGKWHHAILTNSGDMCTMYVDGEVAFMKKKFTRPDPQGHVFKIGYEFKNFYRPFQGEISNVRYFDKALNYEQVIKLTNENKPPIPPVFDWKPDEGKKAVALNEDEKAILKAPIRIHSDFSSIRYANIWVKEN